MFDINAPIDRQRSGPDEVVHIYDTGLDITYPIAAWMKGRGFPVSFTRKGWNSHTGEGTEDLHTLPEPLPLIVSYHNVYDLMHIGAGHGSLICAQHIGDMSATIGAMSATIETTFDPSTGESSAKTVWRKGE